MNKFELSDYYDLLNLHKALMEAKFHENPDNECIAGSPVIANIMNKIVDILTIIDPHAQEINWEKWRKIENHLTSSGEYEYGKKIWVIVLNKISKDKLWKKYNKEQKIIAVKNYFSPFILNENEIKKIIISVDEILLN